MRTPLHNIKVYDNWTSTAYALTVLNETEFGKGAQEDGILNGTIVDEWGYEDERKFCDEYLDFIISINGIGELIEWELDMAKFFNIDLGE